MPNKKGSDFTDYIIILHMIYVIVDNYRHRLVIT